MLLRFHRFHDLPLKWNLTGRERNPLATSIGADVMHEAALIETGSIVVPHSNNKLDRISTQKHMISRFEMWTCRMFRRTLKFMAYHTNIIKQGIRYCLIPCCLSNPSNFPERLKTYLCGGLHHGYWQWFDLI